MVWSNGFGNKFMRIRRGMSGIISLLMAVTLALSGCGSGGVDSESDMSQNGDYKAYDIAEIADMQTVYSMAQTAEGLTVFGENSENSFCKYTSSDMGVTWSESTLDVDAVSGSVYSAAFDADGKVIAGCVVCDDAGNTTD